MAIREHMYRVICIECGGAYVHLGRTLPATLPGFFPLFLFFFPANPAIYYLEELVLTIPPYFTIISPWKMYTSDNCAVESNMQMLSMGTVAQNYDALRSGPQVVDIFDGRSSFKSRIRFYVFENNKKYFWKCKNC